MKRRSIFRIVAILLATAIGLFVVLIFHNGGAGARQIYAYATCEHGRWKTPTLIAGQTRWPAADDRRAGFRGSHLQAAGEAPLGPGPSSVLRFTYLRSFDRPIIVRVDGLGDHQAQLTATELSGAGGYEPGTIVRRETRVLDREDQLALSRALNAARRELWPSGGCEIGLDGASWIIESAGPDGYRYVDQQSPQKGKVRELGLQMLALTGWEFEVIC